MALIKLVANFDRNISLHKGQRLHMKNAYKYRPEFFENCCERIGLQVIRARADSSSAKIYLLKKLPRLIVQTAHLPASQMRV
jgi:hypothetical protein